MAANPRSRAEGGHRTRVGPMKPVIRLKLVVCRRRFGFYQRDGLIFLLTEKL